MALRTYIDGNSVGHAAQHGNSKGGKRLVSGGHETTAIFGTLKSMHKLVRNLTSSQPIVLWDGRSWRYERFPDYKGNRTATAAMVAERERYKAQRREMFIGLHLLGLNQLVAGNMEADDLAAIMTRNSLAKGNMVTLITGDKDWIQLVEKGVVWADHKLDRKVTASNFHEATGFKTQRAFIDCKALAGDTGDNVKPNTGVGEDTAKNLFAVFDDADHFLRTPIDEVMARYQAHHGKKLYHGAVKFHGDPDAQARFRWALEMMDLAHPTIPAPANLRSTRAPIDENGFADFCKRHAFLSILSDTKTFLRPFYTLQEEFHS